MLVPDVAPIVMSVVPPAALPVPMLMVLVPRVVTAPVLMFVVDVPVPVEPMVSVVEEGNAPNEAPPSMVVAKVGAVALTGEPVPVPVDQTGAAEPP